MGCIKYGRILPIRKSRKVRTFLYFLGDNLAFISITSYGVLSDDKSVGQNKIIGIVVQAF